MLEPSSWIVGLAINRPHEGLAIMFFTAVTTAPANSIVRIRNVRSVARNLKSLLIASAWPLIGFDS